MENSLKARAKLIPTLTTSARIYYDYFVSFDYMIVSKTFSRHPYYVIKSNENNFLHLTGLSSVYNPQTFFIKCYKGLIAPEDFSLFKNDSYNYCKQKLSVIQNIRFLLSDPALLVQESFNKGLVSCSFAAENNVLTLGFIKDGEYSYPMTLQKGCFLDPDLAGPITLLLRRQRKEKKFDDLVIGDIATLSKYYSSFKHLLSDRLLDLVASLNNDK